MDGTKLELEKRITVELPVELKTRLDGHSKKTGISLKRLMRNAIENLLKGEKK